MQREEQATKKQLCEDAIVHHSNWQEHEYEFNTKEVQATTTMKCTATQTIVKKTMDKGTQTESQETENEQVVEDNVMTTFNEDSNDIHSVHEPDSSFCEDVDDTDTEDTDTETVEFQHTETNLAPSKSAFIIYWSSLVVLLCRCLTCGVLASIKKCTVRGSLLIVEMICKNAHKNIWRSQPLINRSAHGNIKLSASVLVSSNTFIKLAKYFELADIQWITKTRYYLIQKKYLAGVVNEYWLKERHSVLSELKNSEICNLCGDGRCDSPGHNAKYLTYSMLNQANNKIVDISVVQVTEAGNSNRMEKLGFTRVLNNLENENVKINQIATDRHMQIRKYMREEQPNIQHQFDVWHFCKNIKTKLLAASKKKSCAPLLKWMKSICNHFWWACATCERDEVILREKWTSVLFHIQNKHEWTGCSKFQACVHPAISKQEAKSKEWIKPESDAFKALQTVVLNKSLLSDLKYLTEFSHTGNLEVYHSLYNKWIPKSQHFSHLGMITRSQLAVLDFNQGSNLQHAKTKNGEKRYNVSFSKITKTWSAKPIKEAKQKEYLKDMINRTLEVVSENLTLPLPDLPQNLPSNIANEPKPNKSEVINRQISRFTKRN